MRDYRKLRVFHKADRLLLDVYRWSTHLPHEETYTLKAQIRRSAISIPANIVEGSARLGEGEYIHFLNVALGSSAELAYLVDVAGRLYPSLATSGHNLPAGCVEVRKQLAALVESLRRSANKGRVAP
jgi:four helix bundle protein